MSNIEKLFENYNLVPCEGSGSLGKKTTHGLYSRVKKRLYAFLESGYADNNFHDVRVLSEKIYEDAFPFCPSTLGVAWVAGARKDKKAIFYIRSDFLKDKEKFVSDIESYFCRYLNGFYGAVFELSASLGPASYLSSLITGSDQLDQSPSVRYKERITRWRDNINSGHYPRSGFFREIYPINYVTESHLEKNFKGVPLKEFMKCHGTLRQTNFNSRMYRWDIPDANLEKVCDLLEESGMVLSSHIIEKVKLH